MALSRSEFVRSSVAAVVLAWTPRRVDAQDETDAPPDDGELLPLFPLPMVAFPGEPVPLHIYEPRYKQLIRDCREDGIRFGISAFVGGRLAPHGTEMELADILKEYETGELDILTRGRRVYRAHELLDTYPDKLYPGGSVTFLENDPTFDEDAQDTLVRLFQQYCRLRDVDSRIPEAVPENVSYRMGHSVELSLRQQVELLSRTREADRQAYLIAHLEKVIETHKRKDAEGKIA